MRQSYTGQDVTFEAGADLSALQFTAVKYAAGPATGPDARLVSAAAGDRAHGILQNKPAAAALGAVMRTSGFTKAKVNGGAGAIVAGDPLVVGAGGKLVKGAAAGKAIGFACAPSTVDGDIIQVQIAHHTV